jgi:hypothetical protein
MMRRMHRPRRLTGAEALALEQTTSGLLPQFVDLAELGFDMRWAHFGPRRTSLPF